MKRLITIGLILSLAVPALAEDKVRSVPERKSNANLTEALRQNELGKYREKLDIATYYKFLDFMTMHEDETIRNTQLGTGAALSAIGGYGYWKSLKLRAPGVAGGKPVDSLKLKALRGLSILAIGTGLWQLGAGAASHSMIWSRDARIKKRIDAFVNTPLERAMRAQIGQEKTDEILADFIASGDDPEKTMAISWLEEKDLALLAEMAEKAKAKFLPLLGEHDGQYYIKDADKREYLAEYYGSRLALLELQLRDEGKENQDLMKSLMDAQFQQSLTRIKKDISGWNEETANLNMHAAPKVESLNGSEPVRHK